MRTSEVVALLDLLTSRGTVAWQLAGPTDEGARLVLDTSGVGSAVRLLVSRGFAATEQALPSHVVVAHPRHGRVVLLPCVFASDGSARWFGADGVVEIAADRFDEVAAVPRRVDADLPLPVAGGDDVPPEDGPRFVLGDEGTATGDV